MSYINVANQENMIMFYRLIEKFNPVYYTFGSIYYMSAVFMPVTILQDIKWKYKLIFFLV